VSVFTESTKVESVATTVESTAVESVVGVVPLFVPLPQDATNIAITTAARIVAFFIFVLFFGLLFIM
jgi:hypothetical protein